MSDGKFDETKEKGGKHFADFVGKYIHEEIEARDEETFADLLDSYSTGLKGEVRTGDRISGKIISIGMDTVFIDVGSKIDGVVEKQELLDEEGNFPYQIGDTVDLYVVSSNEGEIKLSRALSGAGGLNLLRDAFSEGVPVEGKVIEECKGGFRVEVMKTRAFCPISQIDLKYVEKPEEYVNQTFAFMITRFEERGRNIVVSRRRLLEKEQQEARKEFMETVSVGDILDGRVTNPMPFGVFVELFPGVQGMVHISELGWSRVENPGELFPEGEAVRVKILDIQEGAEGKPIKISLSIRQVTGDPWEQEEFPVKEGEKIQGRVTRIADFGVFVEVAPGIEGLVHISEMSYTTRVIRPGDFVNAGETVEVMVKEIDREKRRVSLSIRDAVGDPWIDIRNQFENGQTVEGVVEKKEKFGMFITLAPGITGLLPKSKIDRSGKSAFFDKLREGDAITVVIGNILAGERKISLEPGDAKEEGNWKKYSDKKETVSMGSFGEKLLQAMNKEKNKK